MEIKLGDKVKDKHTGFSGVAVARTEFINGCVQFEVQPPTKKGELPESVGVDEQSLVLVKTGAQKKRKDIGGAYSRPRTMRGY